MLPSKRLLFSVFAKGTREHRHSSRSASKRRSDIHLSLHHKCEETLCCTLVLGGMQSRGVLLFRLFSRNNFLAETCELQKLTLDFLQALTSLSVSNLGRGTIPNCTPKLLIRLVNVSDLLSETPDLVPKNL